MVHGSLIYRETGSGLEVRYERGESDSIIVSDVVMRFDSFRLAWPWVAHHWGLEESEEPALWPGDKVYRVTKPDAEMITIKRS